MNSDEFFAVIETGKLCINSAVEEDGHALIRFPVSNFATDYIQRLRNSPPVLSLNGTVLTISSSFGRNATIACTTPDDASLIFRFLEKRIAYEFKHAWDVRTRPQVEEALSRGNVTVVTKNLEVAVQIHREGVTELRRNVAFSDDDPRREFAHLIFYRIYEPDAVPEIGDVLSLPRVE